jgi:hypothetical protein
MQLQETLKIVLLTTSSVVVVINCVLLIKSRCCQSECIMGLKNQKNISSNNIDNNV